MSLTCLVQQHVEQKRECSRLSELENLKTAIFVLLFGHRLLVLHVLVPICLSGAVYVRLIGGLCSSFVYHSFHTAHRGNDSGDDVFLARCWL